MTIEDMQARAALKDGACLSKEYVSQISPLLWRCEKGHTWEATPAIIIQGAWCMRCSNKRKHTIEDMYRIAKAKGGQCLSEVYVNTNTKLQWQCADGHIWESIPKIILNKSWCPYCYGNIKLSIEEMQQIAKSRGGECLSEKYINKESKLKWKCNAGHVWSARPGAVKKGTWCPICALNNSGKHNEKGDTLEDMQRIAVARGGKCISAKYFNSSTHLSWQCKRGHIWSAIPESVKRGSWCGKCANMDRRQRQMDYDKL